MSEKAKEHGENKISRRMREMGVKGDGEEQMDLFKEMK